MIKERLRRFGREEQGGKEVCGFGSKDPPFAKDAKDGAPSSSFVANSNLDKRIFMFSNRFA